MRGDILTDTVASSFLGKKGVAEKFKGSVLKNSAVNRSIKLQKVFGSTGALVDPWRVKLGFNSTNQGTIRF
jgi:hypothetical protein